MKHSINSNTLSNQISMMRSHPMNKDKAILLVEGPSDKVFFKNLLDHKIQIIIAEGKTNVLYSLEKLIERETPGILAVIDTDFDLYYDNSIFHNFRSNIRKKMVKILFTTDTHDLESMLIRSYAIEKFINQYGDEDLIKNFEKKYNTDLISHIISMSKIIGIFRLLSLQNNWQLSFKKINYHNFMDLNKIIINIDRFIREVKTNSKNSHITIKEIIKSYNKCISDIFDPWMLSTGHDIMKIILIVLKEKLGIQHKMKLFDRIYQIEDILILSYEFSFFTKTELYHKLSNWQEQNHKYILFAQ